MVRGNKKFEDIFQPESQRRKQTYSEKARELHKGSREKKSYN